MKKEQSIEVNTRSKAERIYNAIFERVTYKKECWSEINQKSTYIIFYKSL